MKNKMFAAALMSCLTAAALVAAPTVRAGNNDYSQTIDSVPVKKYLVVKKGVFVPNVTFRYTLAPGQAVEATADTHEIFPGPAGAVFASSGKKYAFASFTPSDTVTPEADAPDGSTVRFATSDTSDEEYAEKTLTVDLSGVTFPAAGIYRYVVTEEDSGLAGITQDSDNKRYIDVFVHKSDQTDDEEYVAGSAVIRLNDGAPDADGKARAAVKSSGFTNRYDTNNIGFSKSVTGNQASFNQYFKFTVKLTGNKKVDESNTLVKVSGEFDEEPAENMATRYDGDVMAAANAGLEYVTLADLRNGRDFYIKHGQSVELTGIPDGMGYEVSEEKLDYTPSVAVTGDSNGTVEEGRAMDGSLTEDTTLAFTNARNGIIPSTGISAAFALPLAVMAGGIAGIVLLYVRRIKKKARKGNAIEQAQ